MNKSDEGSDKSSECERCILPPEEDQYQKYLAYKKFQAIDKNKKPVKTGVRSSSTEGDSLHGSINY